MARRTDWRVGLLTPRAAGGVAVLSLTGSDQRELARSILGDARGPGSDVDVVPRVRWIWIHGKAIDQVVAFERPEVGSIEVHLHASEAVLRSLEVELGVLAPPPHAPLAAALAAARGEAQLAFLLEQQALLSGLAGGFSSWLTAHARDAAALAAALARSEPALALLHPCRVAIRGRKNAGKSTLMNRLLLKERVLTGAEPGLTRDPIGEVVMLDGYPYELVDTAGEGSPLDALDARAMQLGRAVRAVAWRLIVADLSQQVGDVERQLVAEGERCIVVGSKSDLPPAPWPVDVALPDVRVACLDPRSAVAVRASIGATLRRRRALPAAGPAGGVAPTTLAEVEALRAVMADLPGRMA